MHYFARGLCAPFLWLCACYWLVAAQGRHAQTNAGHSRTRDRPAQAPHVLAGTRCPPTQADWQTQKQRQGTRRQVQSTRKQEGHVVQAPEPGKIRPGKIRPSKMVNDGPNERSVGIRSRLVSEDVGLLLSGAQPVSAPLAGERVGSCHLDPTVLLQST